MAFPSYDEGGIENEFAITWATLTKMLFDPTRLKKKLNRWGFFTPEGPRGAPNAASVRVCCATYRLGVLGAGRLALISMQRGSIHTPIHIAYTHCLYTCIYTWIYTWIYTCLCTQVQSQLTTKYDCSSLENIIYGASPMPEVKTTCQSSCQSHIPKSCDKATFQSLVSEPYSKVLCQSHIPKSCVKAIFQSLVTRPYSKVLCQSHIPKSCVRAIFQSLVSRPYSKVL